MTCLGKIGPELKRLEERYSAIFAEGGSLIGDQYKLCDHCVSVFLARSLILAIKSSSEMDDAEILQALIIAASLTTSLDIALMDADSVPVH